MNRRGILRSFRGGAVQPLLIVVAAALGVAVVTAVVAYIGSSYQQQALMEQDLSFREITVQSRTDDPGLYDSSEPLPRRVGSVSVQPVVLRAADLKGVRDAAPSVDYAYVNEYHGGIYGDQPFNLNAVTTDYLAAARVEVTAGNTLAPSDFREPNPVMLITPEGAAQASITGNPIGKTVSDPSTGTGYTIIGLLPSSDDPYAVSAIVPYKLPATASVFQVTPEQVYQLRFAVEDTAKLDTARADVEAYARKTWGEGVTVSSESLTAVRGSTRLTMLFTAVFASLGLLIAAFNILNLFLARVLRQQREVALRRALGASRWRVRRGVLSEAAWLGTLGGVLGVVAGYGLVLVFDRYIQRVTEGGWPELSLSPLTILIGVAVAPLLSLAFSFYPALVASRVSIHDALGES